MLRIDLERQEVSHTDSVMLYDTVDVEKLKKYDSSGDPLSDENVLIDMDEASYAEVRAYQRSHINKSIR